MALRHPLVVVTVAAGLLLVPSSPATAKTGTLGGGVTNGVLPGGSTGESWVRAIRVADGRVAASAELPRRGRWGFELDEGWYVVVASIVRSDRAGLSAIAPVQRVRAGRTTRTNVSLKRTRTPRVKRKRRPARAAASTTAPVGVDTAHFTGTGPEPHLGRGLARMINTELVNARSGDCTPTVVELEHRADVQREIDLANSRISDPRSRIPRGNLLDAAVLIRGNVATTASSASWTVNLVDASTGDVIGTEAGSASLGDVLDAPADIAQQIADRLCGADYRVNFSINAMITIPPYAGTGIAIADVPAHDISATMPPTRWMGQADLAHSALVYSGVEGCVVTPGFHGGFVRVEIVPLPGDQIQLTWGGDTAGNQTILTCAGVSIPNGVLPVMPLLGTGPTVLVFPATGGTQNLSGSLGAPGGGWTNSGTVTVTRVPRGS